MDLEWKKLDILKFQIVIGVIGEGEGGGDLCAVQY